MHLSTTMYQYIFRNKFKMSLFTRLFMKSPISMSSLCMKNPSLMRFNFQWPIVRLIQKWKSHVRIFLLKKTALRTHPVVIHQTRRCPLRKTTTTKSA